MGKRTRNVQPDAAGECLKKCKGDGNETASNVLSDRIFYECDRELPEFNVDEHREYAFKIMQFYKNNTDDIVAWAKDAPFNILYTSNMRQLWRDLKAGECFAQTLHEEWTDVLENIWRHQRFNLQSFVWLWDNMFTRDTKIEFVRECLGTYHCTFGKLEAWKNSDVNGVSLNISDPEHMGWVVNVQTGSLDQFFDLLFDGPFDLKSGAFGDMLAKQWIEYVVDMDFVNDTGLSFITMYRERMVQLFRGVLRTLGKMEHYVGFRDLSMDAQVERVKGLFTVSHNQLKEQFGPPSGLCRTFSIQKHFEWGINGFQKACADGHPGVYDWLFIQRAVQLPLDFILNVRDAWFQRLVMRMHDFFDIVVQEWTKLLHRQIPILKRSFYSDTLPSLQDVEKELRKTIPAQEMTIVKNHGPFCSATVTSSQVLGRGTTFGFR